MITALEADEVSPVRGANRTRTLSIKARPPTPTAGPAPRPRPPASPPDPALVAMRDQLEAQRRAEHARLVALRDRFYAGEAEQRAQLAGSVLKGHQLLAKYAHLGSLHGARAWR